MSLAAEFSCLSDHDPDSLSVDQARAFIRRQLTPVRTRERVALRGALGRVLACDLLAPFNVPGHDNSAMDGYAVRHADVANGGNTRLRVLGTALAGKAFAQPIAGCPHLAAHYFCEVFADRKPEACAAVFACGGRISLREGLEESAHAFF